MTQAETATDTFHLTIDYRTGDSHARHSRLNLQLQNLFDIDRHDDKFGTLIAWGAPALDGKIVGAQELALRARDIGIDALAGKLDCSFLIIHYDLAEETLKIITDRTGSFPIYYCVDDGRFLASSSFKRLFDFKGAGSSANLDHWTVAEFFYFRRVFNARTYDRNISYLPCASILSVGASGKNRIHRYWTIGSAKLHQNQDLLAEQLAALLQRSMQTYMSDDRRFGLLLSGGLDARALLAASANAPVCFTTTPQPNNELSVARQLANIKGAEHVYIQRPEQLLNDALDPSVALSGGMTIYSEVQFLGYGPSLIPKADTIFMGLALDIMFCGHYLPKSLVAFAGRTGWHFQLNPLTDDLPRAFVDTISYRVKTSDPMRVIRAKYRDEMRARLMEAVRQEIDEGRAIGLQGYDLWEFVHLHNLSRHYSFLMAQSVRTFAACRIPALTNALYDLCWALRAEDKANWAVYQKAIALLNPAMMKVRNANTNIRADMPLQRQSAIKLGRAIANKIGLRAGASPSWWDRSWPEARQAIDANPEIQRRAAQLTRSEHIAAAKIFDPEAIERVVAEHINGQHDHTILINQLITIDRALEPLSTSGIQIRSESRQPS